MHNHRISGLPTVYYERQQTGEGQGDSEGEELLIEQAQWQLQEMLTDPLTAREVFRNPVNMLDFLNVPLWTQNAH